MSHNNTNRDFSIQFDNISELVSKVEKLKGAHEIETEKFKKVLKKNNIQFKELDEYGVLIDIGNLSKKQMNLIKSKNTTFIDKVYKEVGVIKNELD